MKRAMLLLALCCASGYTLRKTMNELDNLSLFSSDRLSCGE